MGKLGFNILPGTHPICPVMLGDAALATRFSDALLAQGVYVIGFNYPVVLRGKPAFARRSPPRTRARIWNRLCRRSRR